ncbi:hypothetical protein KKD19_04665 [Patescibacteria group bacterium]|nr:hypothetical protein [Patescibacteria group bacterium]MCG2693520.1 hypothetical protein [Candidatus Parcubacteria bacterium]
MNFKKNNLIIVLTLAIVIAGLLYWGGGLFVSERKNIYYEKYINLYTLDFSQADDLSKERQEQYLEELEVWKDLLKKGEKGDLVKSFIGLAFLKERTSAYKMAEQALMLAGEVDPDNAVSFGNLANLYYFFMKDYPKAEQAYLKAIDNYPFKIDYYRDLSGLYQYHYNDLKKSEEILIRCVKNNPKDADAFKIITSFYVDQKDKEKAVWYYNQLKDISPESAALFEEKVNSL